MPTCVTILRPVRIMRAGGLRAWAPAGRPAARARGLHHRAGLPRQAGKPVLRLGGARPSRSAASSSRLSCRQVEHSLLLHCKKISILPQIPNFD